MGLNGTHLCRFIIIGILICLFCLGCSEDIEDISPTTSETKVYYVSVEGSDANEGSFENPFRRINKALSMAIPGDTILVRGGTYYEKVIFPKSGRAGKTITLKAYPNEKPILDGTGLSIIGKEALVTIRNVDYINFEGFDVCNYKSSTPWVNINGILADEGASNITIRGNEIYNIEHNVALEDGRSGHAIEIIGNTSSVMQNILVEDNVIHDCNTGYSENLTINGYVDGFVIRNNTIYNGENIGIDAAGGYWANENPDYNYARNGIISENHIYNIENSLGPLGGYGAIGIYVDGARNIIVERNDVHNSDRGIGIVSESDGYPTKACIVRNNFVYNCWRTGVFLGGYLNYTGGGTYNCYVLNNTLFQNNKVLGYFDEVEGEIRLTENCFNNVIANNIIYARPGSEVFVHKYTSTGENNVIDNNLYYAGSGATTWIWEGEEYHEFENWKLASGADAASSNGIDPLLKNPFTPDLHITSTSPAINSGKIVSMDIHGEYDIDGQPRIINNKISKGAHQFND